LNIESFNKRHSEIIDLVQKEFDRNTDKYGNKIKCCKGCSQCCHQIFNITLIDEFVITKFVTKLHDEKRSLLKNKAKNYLASVNITKDKSGDFSKKSGIPCPALGDKGECTIYDGRPLICRRFGPPIFDYKNPSNIYACELNFEPGEEIFDDDLIPKQTHIGKLWDNFKTEFNHQFEMNARTSTTIAEAILNS